MTTPQDPRSIDAIIDSVDGGPAFPQGFDGGPYDGGMSLRDWFAGMAMQGIMAAQEPESFFYESPDDEHASWVAPTAFIIADAMLAARKEAK